MTSTRSFCLEIGESRRLLQHTSGKLQGYQSVCQPVRAGLTVPRRDCKDRVACTVCYKSVENIEKCLLWCVSGTSVPRRTNTGTLSAASGLFSPLLVSWRALRHQIPSTSPTLQPKPLATLQRVMPTGKPSGQTSLASLNNAMPSQCTSQLYGQGNVMQASIHVAHTHHFSRQCTNMELTCKYRNYSKHRS